MLGRAPFEQALHLVLVPRARDEVGGVPEVPTEAAHDVGIGLAKRVGGTRVIVGRADSGKVRRRQDPRRGELDLLEAHRLLDLGGWEAEVCRQAAGRGADLLGRGLLVLVPPAPVLASASAHGGASVGGGIFTNPAPTTTSL